VWTARSVVGDGEGSRSITGSSRCEGDAESAASDGDDGVAAGAGLREVAGDGDIGDGERAITGVIESNGLRRTRAADDLGCEIQRSDRERNGGKDAVAGECDVLANSGVAGDNLERAGAHAVSGGSEADSDGTGGVGKDGRTTSVGLSKIAGKPKGANGSGVDGVIGDGGRERNAGGTDDGIGEGENRGADRQGRGAREFVRAQIDGGDAITVAIYDAGIGGNVLRRQVGSGVVTRVDGRGSRL